MWVAFIISLEPANKVKINFKYFKISQQIPNFLSAPSAVQATIHQSQVGKKPIFKLGHSGGRQQKAGKLLDLSRYLITIPGLVKFSLF